MSKKGKTMAKNKGTAKVIEQVEISTPVQRVRPAVDEKGFYKTVDMSMEELDKKGLKTKSAIIRFLHGERFSRTAIANFLGIRYQHVRNTLIQQPKRVPASATNTEPTATKEDGEGDA